MKNLQEVLELIFPLCSAFEASLADGKLDYMDALKFLPLLKKVGPAFSDSDLIATEMATASDKEWDGLLLWAKQSFNLKDDNLEEKVELGLEIAVEMAKLIAHLREQKSN